tara:strand:- start:100 stop:447 length:348 start_codon:yes stop_codon:yes gene_type:complete
MAKETIKEMLEMIDAKINHIEDISADNRAIIIKLVKQSNQIVQFLKQIEVEDVNDDFENILSSPMLESEKIKSDRMEELKEMVNELMDKQQDLKEFEEELEKNKDKLTPGTIGES